MSIISVVSTNPAQAINRNSEATRVNELIPQALRENAQNLIDIISDYYDWLSQENNTSQLIDNVVHNQDLDQVSSEFIDGIAGEIAKNIPNSQALDKVALYRKIVQFYKIKGSEASVSAFFRIFFDIAVEVSYPKEQLFKLSSGNWKARNYVEDTVLRANYLGGTQPLDNNQIGSFFEVLDLYGQVLGTAQLSTFTSIDETFDIPLSTANLILQYDTEPDTDSVVSPTQWIDKQQSEVLSRNDDITFDTIDNKFDFDGVNDSISTDVLSTDLSSNNETTTLTRFARKDNTTNDKNQCIYAYGEYNRLYLDRPSGKLKLNLPNHGHFNITRVSSTTIEVHNSIGDADGQYIINNDNNQYVLDNDNVIQHDGEHWLLNNQYQSQNVPSTTDPASINLQWKQIYYRGFNQYNNIISLSNNTILHAIDYELNLFQDEIFKQKIEYSTPIRDISYDQSTKQLYVITDNDSIRQYNLNDYNRLDLNQTVDGVLDNITDISATDGKVVTIANQIVYTSTANDLGNFIQILTGEKTYISQHSSFAILGNDLIYLRDSNETSIAAAGGFDRYADDDGDRIALGNSQTGEIRILQKTFDGFWTAPSADSSVSITLVSHVGGQTNTVQWGPTSQNFTSSDTGLILSRSFNVSDTDSVNSVSNWNLIQTIQDNDLPTISSIYINGTDLLVSNNHSELHYFVDSGSEYLYNNFIADNKKDSFKSFSVNNNRIYSLTNEHQNQIISIAYPDLNDYQEIDLITVNYTDLDSLYTNSQLPVLDIETKYYTVAVKGNRSFDNGFIDISLNGAPFERVFEGNTIDYLFVPESAPLSIGCNNSQQDYFSGLLTNHYYYNAHLTLAQIGSIIEYLEAINNNWFMLQFSNLQGTLVGVDSIREIVDGAYQFDRLSGYEVDAFWFLDSDPEVGGVVNMDVNYGDTITTRQRVTWADNTSQSFIKQSKGNRLSHTFVGEVVGKYLDRKGFLSDNIKIHDGEYYQEYSYVINPSIGPAEWEDAFLKLVHPAGLKYIAALLLLIPRTNDWVGPNIVFDKETGEYVWNRPGDNFNDPYSTKRPRWDLEWQKGLIPSYLSDDEGPNGYHFPIYQPGWLDDYTSFLITLAGDMFPDGANSESFERLNKLARKLLVHPGTIMASSNLSDSDSFLNGVPSENDAGKNNFLENFHTSNSHYKVNGKYVGTFSRDAESRTDYLGNLKFKDHGPISDYLNTPLIDTMPHDHNNIIGCEYPSYRWPVAKDRWVESRWSGRFSNFPAIVLINGVLP